MATSIGVYDLTTTAEGWTLATSADFRDLETGAALPATKRLQRFIHAYHYEGAGAIRVAARDAIPTTTSGTIRLPGPGGAAAEIPLSTARKNVVIYASAAGLGLQILAIFSD